MENSVSKIKKEIDDLLKHAEILLNVLIIEVGVANKSAGEEEVKLLKDIRSKKRGFIDQYQGWYSKALVLVKKLIPDRARDFESFYEPDKNRKTISPAAFKIQDYVTGNIARSMNEWGGFVEFRDCSNGFYQQLTIVKAARDSIDSAIHQIQQLLHAQIFDDELKVAEELLAKGHIRPAGGMAGVVLESHLKTVCKNNTIPIAEKSATLGKLKELLVKEGIIDIPTSRKIEFVGDIRNKCAHKSKDDPTDAEVADMISEVSKLIKRIQ